MIDKIMPTRKSSKKSGSVLVADLDSMVTKTVTFKVHGKMHEIPPLSVEEFMVFTARYSEVMALQQKEKVTPAELIDAYYMMVNSVCKTISKEDIKSMSQNQVAALYQLMVDVFTGKVFADEKKTLEKMAALLSHPQS